MVNIKTIVGIIDCIWLICSLGTFYYLIDEIGFTKWILIAPIPPLICLGLLNATIINTELINLLSYCYLLISPLIYFVFRKFKFDDGLFYLVYIALLFIHINVNIICEIIG